MFSINNSTFNINLWANNASGRKLENVKGTNFLARTPGRSFTSNILM